MASPQCENGFLKLAHELVRVFIRARVSGRVKDAVLAVAERTWGYGLTDAVIPTATLASDMGMATNDARRVLGQAAALNMIVKVERGSSSAPRWRVNKDYETWLCDIRVRKPEKPSGSLDELKKWVRGGQTATPSELGEAARGEGQTATPSELGEAARGGGQTATPSRGGQTATRSKKRQKDSAAVSPDGEGDNGKNTAAAECASLQPQEETASTSDLDALTGHYLGRFREATGAAYGYGTETARRVLANCLAAADDPGDVAAAVDLFFKSADFGDGGPPLFRARLPALLLEVRRRRAEEDKRQDATRRQARRLDEEERQREAAEARYARIEAHIAENLERLEKEARARLATTETWLCRHLPAQAMAQAMETLAAAELGLTAEADKELAEIGGAREG
ncbi:MAG TPA: replication protein [Planctomycetota bacterium]|nr:replication protein [Planctomycetota bacterium]